MKDFAPERACPRTYQARHFQKLPTCDGVALAAQRSVGHSESGRTHHTVLRGEGGAMGRNLS